MCYTPPGPLRNDQSALRLLRSEEPLVAEREAIMTNQNEEEALVEMSVSGNSEYAFGPGRAGKRLSVVHARLHGRPLP